jgi:hypothetical protein
VFEDFYELFENELIKDIKETNFDFYKVFIHIIKGIPCDKYIPDNLKRHLI